MNSKIEERDNNNNFEKGDIKKKHKISKRSANSVNTDLQQSNAEKLNCDNVAAISNLKAQRSNDELSDYAEEAHEEVAKQDHDKDEKMSSLVRLARDVNAGLQKYTDQERSSLYDDYEAKDVAKRGVLGSPEDYEEAEVDSPEIEDMAAMQEQGSMINDADKREMQNDARVKRDQGIAEAPDKFKLISDDPVKSKIAPEDSHLHEVSPVESLKSCNEASTFNDASKIKESELNEATSKASDASKIAESAIASPDEDEANEKYEKRVEEEIQRKIDSIKEEIRRDIEAQGRIRGIERNNARFDELQNQEDERQNEEGSSFENEPVEKRQIVAKRSVREVANIATASSKKSDKKRSLKKQQRKKPQRTRGKKIGKSDISKKNKNPKRRSVANHDESSEQAPAKGLLKKKRERVRQTFPMNNEQAKKRRSTSYALSSDSTGVRSESDLLKDQNSHLYTDNKMVRLNEKKALFLHKVLLQKLMSLRCIFIIYINKINDEKLSQLQAPLSVASEDEDNEGEQSPAVVHSNSLASLTGSSQELNPRLAKEYKEAFGGLQSEPGNALARFKRIKRVLESPELEKI